MPMSVVVGRSVAAAAVVPAPAAAGRAAVASAAAEMVADARVCQSPRQPPRPPVGGGFGPPASYILRETDVHEFLYGKVCQSGMQLRSRHNEGHNVSAHRTYETTKPHPRADFSFYGVLLRTLITEWSVNRI